MQVRFVGGEVNNQHLEAGSRPCQAWGTVSGVYYLHRFRTPHGTRYVQYVHESLIANNGKPDACTYKEKFKKWNLNTKATT